MHWLNFHHLLYFRLVAREGSVAAAARALRLSRSTISAQVRLLEKTLGRPLFTTRAGRPVLTAFGVEVMRVADEVESLGHTVQRLAQGEVAERPISVGVSTGLPASTVAAVLEPTLASVRVRCRSADTAALVEWLSEGLLDAVFSNEPAPPGSGLRSRRILTSDVALFAAPKLARALAKGLPDSLRGAPFVLPDTNSSLGAMVRRWLAQRNIRVREVAIADDLELMRRLAARGLGVFPVRTSFSRDVEQLYGVQRVCELPGLVERCHLLTPRGQDSAFVQALLASATSLRARPSHGR